MARTTILAEQTIDGFVFSDGDQAYTPGYVNPSQYVLTEGEIYTVVWDSETYECTAVSFSYNSILFVAVGDTSTFGITANGEPFLMLYNSTYDNSQIFTNSEETSHAIAIYQVTEDKFIVIKDPTGTDQNYTDKDKIRLNFSDGTKQIYSKGEAVSGIEVGLDFSNGDQTITAPTGTLVKSAVIKKPDGLSEENIAEGITIAGINGIFKGGGGEIEDDLRYFRCHIDPKSRTTTLYNAYTNLAYADTGKNDLIIPDTLAGQSVMINSHPWFFNNAHVENIAISNDVGYVNDSMGGLFSGCVNFNASVHIPEGVTNMYETFRGCKMFNQPVNMPDSVTTVINIFMECHNFNQPVKLSNAILDTKHMFFNCYNYNQPTSIPPNATSLYFMFTNCYSFNQSVTIPASVTNLAYTFCDCNKFNQPVIIPDSVTTMCETFRNCRNLNVPMSIGAGVTNLSGAFKNCSNFGSNVTVLSSGVTNIKNMFYGKNNSKRVNVFVPAGSTTNTTFNNVAPMFNVSSVTMTNDTANNCRYNTARNIYVYWR